MNENQESARPLTAGEVRRVERVLLANLRGVENSLRADMKRMENSLRADMKRVENSLRMGITQLRAELRAEVRKIRNDQWKILGIALFVVPVALELIRMVFDLLRG